MQKSTTSGAASFERRFRRALRHLKQRSALHAAARIVPWLELGWLAAFVLGRAGWPIVSTPWAAAGLAAVLLAGVALRLWRAPAGRDAALVLDRGLGTRELVTAAHEAAGERHPFARLARRRATVALTPPAVAAALPFVGWRGWRPAILGTAAVVAALFLPVPPEGAAAARAIEPVVEETAETLARELEPLAEEVAESQRPEAEEALERLRQLIDEMQGGEIETVDDALVAVNRLEQTFRELSDEAAASGFEELVQGLGAEPLSADLATAMTEGDRQALRESLHRMGEALTGPEARSAALERQIEVLKERLSELAGLLEMSGESELAAAVRELLEALEQGDLEKAREMLESAEIAGACKAAGDRAGTESLKGQLAELLGLGRYLLGQGPAGLDSEGAGSQGSGSQGSRSQGSRAATVRKLDSRGPHPGTETTHLEAEGYATGDPILRDRQTAETASWEVEFESMWQSRLERGEGEDLKVSGRTGEAGELLSQAGRGLGMRGEGSLPLKPFAAAGAGDAERAADLESVPLGYRDLVRRYFQRRPPPAAETPAAESSTQGEQR